MRWISVPVLAITLATPLTLGAGRAVAQEATPVAGPDTAVACTVAPRSVDELIALWFDPAGTPLATPLPASVPTEADLPQGAPADPATVAAVNATAQEITACFEAEQYARAFALMTDDLVHQFGPQEGETMEETRAFLEAQLAATPTPEGTPTAAQPLRDVRVLADGRVGGILEEEGQISFVFFEDQAGRWLFDDYIQLGAAEGTPAP